MGEAYFKQQKEDSFAYNGSNALLKSKQTLPSS